jgi:hypothetical protein
MNLDDVDLGVIFRFVEGVFRLYLYGGLGWWFGSLGNQSYVQNRFEKCVFFLCVFCICFIFCLTNLI